VRSEAVAVSEDQQWWTLTDIAAWAGLTVRAAESRMRRLQPEVMPHHRQPGRAGKNVWSPDTVRAAWIRAGWGNPDAAVEQEAG
jgi:hypothetical protein